MRESNRVPRSKEKSMSLSSERSDISFGEFEKEEEEE